MWSLSLLASTQIYVLKKSFLLYSTFLDFQEQILQDTDSFYKLVILKYYLNAEELTLKLYNYF